MSSKLLSTRPRRFVVTALVLVLGILAGSQVSIWAEKSVSRPESVPMEVQELVFDIARGKIVLKMYGVIVREYALLGDPTSTEAVQATGSGPDDGPESQTLRQVLLVSASGQIPKTELEIIAEESRISPEKLQRFQPGKMVLITDDGTLISIESDSPGAVTFFWPHTTAVVRRLWSGLLGRDAFRFTLSVDDAMSLYGVARTRPSVTIRK